MAELPDRSARPAAPRCQPRLTFVWRGPMSIKVRVAGYAPRSAALRKTTQTVEKVTKSGSLSLYRHRNLQVKETGYEMASRSGKLVRVF
jgi:hypothetical protein